MRIVKVVLILIALAATAGAVVGVLSLVVLMLFKGQTLLTDSRAYLAAASVGAIMGGLSGPAIAFLFLRRVPIWRATVETAAAAGVGAVVGLSVNDDWWIIGALVFALLAALRLRYAYRASKTSSAPPSEVGS